MNKWLVALLLLAGGAANGADAPRQVPPMEVHLKQADAVDLLQLLAGAADRPTFVVRPTTDIRVDYEHEHFTPDALRDELAGLLGLRLTHAGDFDVWTPDCAAPVFRTITFPKENRVTMHFDDAPAGALLHLLADVEELELSVPKGYPGANVAVAFDKRTTGEIAGIVAATLGATFKVVGKTLEVRPAPISRATCDTARFKWQKEEATSPAVADAPAKPFFGSKNCGRLARFPGSAETSCTWHESFPLSAFHFRGYLLPTPHGSPVAYVEPDDGFGPILVSLGERLSEEFVGLTQVNRDAAWLARFDQQPGGKRVVTGALSVSYDDGAPREREPTSEDRNQRPTGMLERYGLEDLLMVSASQDAGDWTAQIKTIHGLMWPVKIGSYMGTSDGRITAIDANGLDVFEIARDPAGVYYERIVRLQRGVWYERPRDAIRRRLAFREIDSPAQQQLLRAAQVNDVAALARAVDDGADVNATYRQVTALFAAVAIRKGETIDAARWLLDHGARPDGIFDKYEETPLTLAATDGKLRMAELLLEAGADVDLPDIGDRTPLYFAAQNGHPDIARLLVEHRADPRAISELGLTPFLIAAYHGHVEIVKLLMNAGVSIDDAGRDGHTMLHAAVLGRKTDLVRALITLGADVNARNQRGESILDVASAKDGDKTLQALLVSKGAKSGTRD